MRKLKRSEIRFANCQKTALVYCLALVAFSPASAQAKWLARCFESLKSIEQKIISHLSEKKFAQSAGKPIRHAVLQENIDRAERHLRASGMKFEKVPIEESRKARMMLATGILARQNRFSLEDGPDVDLETVANFYRVLSAQPDAHVHDSPLGAAIDHRNFPDLIKRIEKLEHELYVDPTIDVTVMGGYRQDGNRSNKPRIVIGLDTPYHTLIHEIDHAEFEHYQIESFLYTVDKLVAQGAGDSVFPLVMKDYLGYGEKKLWKIVELVRAGIPADRVPISEAMAVDAQVRALADAGPSVDLLKLAKWRERSEKYAKRHFLDGLVEKAKQYGELEPKQRALLLKYLDELGIVTSDRFKGTELPHLVARYRKHVRPANASALLAGAAGGAAVVISIVFREELGQLLLFLSNGDSIFVQVSEDDEEKRKKRRLEGGN